MKPARMLLVTLTLFAVSAGLGQRAFCQFCTTDCLAGSGFPVTRNQAQPNAPAIVDSGKLWRPGQQIGIAVLDHEDDARLMDFVMTAVRRWEPYVNLRLVFARARRRHISPTSVSPLTVRGAPTIPRSARTVGATLPPLRCGCPSSK